MGLLKCSVRIFSLSMSSKPFDSFSKEYLEEFLTSTGTVSTGLEVRDETRQVDVLYMPDPGKESDRQQLGLLGRMAAQPSLFEPYSKRPGINEVRSCILKLMVVLLDAVRAAKRKKQPTPAETELPMLWILSPSASPTLMKHIGGEPETSWPEGVYFSVDVNRTGFVAIDRLPETPETLWVRLLGRNPTLERAIGELMAMPRGPKRDTAVRVLSGWKSTIGAIENPDEEDRELLMTLSPAFIEWEQRTKQKGVEQGIEQGIEQGTRNERRLNLSNLMKARFEELDEELNAVIENFTKLSAEDYTEQFPLLLNLSRDELVARFGVLNGSSGNSAQK